MARPNTIELAFKKAPDGPSIFTPESQAEREAITTALQNAGITYSYPEREMAFDSAEHLTEIVIGTGVAFRMVRPVILEWIRARAGQKVVINDGKRSVEAPTIEDAERAWDKATETTDVDEPRS